jgi:class 3 adenylate cyclase
MKGSIKTRFFLFADVRNFSRVPDRCMDQFVDGFLGKVIELLRDPGSGLSSPLYANTWGDAFMFVYDSAEACGEAALGIREWLRCNPVRFEGMPAALGLRIGMHAGPVFEGYDPVADRPIYLGSHINRAARIEPITEEGQIFVSREFAALAEMEGVTRFRCLAQGLADLPKGAGRIPVYRLERAATDSEKLV